MLHTRFICLRDHSMCWGVMYHSLHTRLQMSAPMVQSHFQRQRPKCKFQTATILFYRNKNCIFFGTITIRILYSILNDSVITSISGDRTSAISLLMTAGYQKRVKMWRSAVAWRPYLTLFHENLSVVSSFISRGANMQTWRYNKPLLPYILRLLPVNKDIMKEANYVSGIYITTRSQTVQSVKWLGYDLNDQGSIPVRASSVFVRPIRPTVEPTQSDWYRRSFHSGNATEAWSCPLNSIYFRD
jgi:hypothetical protein